MKLESTHIKENRLIINNNSYDEFLTVKQKRVKKLTTMNNLYLNKIHEICSNKNVFIVDKPTFMFLTFKTIFVNSVIVSLENFIKLVKEDKYNMFFVYYFNNEIIKFNTYHLEQLKIDLNKSYYNIYDTMYIIISSFINDYDIYIKNNLILNEV